MVQFNGNANFNITVDGDRGGYIELLEVLLDSIAYPSDTESYNKDRYVICNLIKSMLPSENQIVNIEDADMLKQIKGENKNKITSFIDGF